MSTGLLEVRGERLTARLRSRFALDRAHKRQRTDRDACARVERFDLAVRRTPVLDCRHAITVPLTYDGFGQLHASSEIIVGSADRLRSSALSKQSIEEALLSSPCLVQHFSRHTARRISQCQGDDDDVIERPDHGQELRYQVDRGDHPQRSKRDRELRPLRDTRIAAQLACRRNAGRQDPGKILQDAWRQRARENDEKRPTREQHPYANQNALQPVHRRTLSIKHANTP
jgi:hypothetical protein